MASQPRTLTIEPLTAEAFRPFGDVIDIATARHFTINEGFAERYDNLARIDVAREAGYPRLSIFRAKPRSLPFALSLLERHPLGSQAFVPMSPQPYLVVVSEGADAPDLASIRCFRAASGQGVNYAPGTWHHPLLAFAVCDFVVVDRGGPEDIANCDEVMLTAGAYWVET